MSDGVRIEKSVRPDMPLKDAAPSGQRSPRDEELDEESREIHEAELEHGGAQGRYARGEDDSASYFPAEGDQPE